MQEVVTVRMEPKLKGKLEEMSRQRLEKKSDIIREALMEYIKKEMEMNEIRKMVSQKFAEGSVSFEQMVEILGYKEARKIAYFVEIAKKSFEEGLV